MGLASGRRREDLQDNTAMGDIAPRQPDYGSNSARQSEISMLPSISPTWLTEEGTASVTSGDGVPDWSLPELVPDEPLLPTHDGKPTEHSPLLVHEAQNPPPERERETRTGERDVRILQGAQAPLQTVGKQPMDEARLYDERAPEGECEDGWHFITSQYGTARAPYEDAQIDPSTLFIDGRPSIEDIHQGSLGDCYFLAALTAVVASDPGKIPSMMTLSGESVCVELFHYIGDDKWAPVHIDVSLSFLHSTPEEGSAKLVGASPRLSQAPARRQWWADVSGDELQVCSHDFYEASLWVPVLEKAYALFAETYGQRGGANEKEAEPRLDPDGNPRSGYDIIGKGGYENDIYPLIYGGDVENQRRGLIRFAPGGLLLEDNLSILYDLVMVDTVMRDGGEGLLTVSLDEDEAVARLHEQILWMRGEPFLRDYPGLSRWMVEMDVLLDAWRAAPKDAKKAPRKAVSDAARRAVVPSAWPVLDTEREGGVFHDLQELLLAVSSLDNEWNGPRSIYTPHAYTVLSSRFCDNAGNELPITKDNLKEELPDISPRLSTVELRNPHGENEPDPSGAIGGDGVFSLDLDQFFRLFSHSEFTRIRKEGP